MENFDEASSYCQQLKLLADQLSNISPLVTNDLLVLQPIVGLTNVYSTKLVPCSYSRKQPAQNALKFQPSSLPSLHPNLVVLVKIRTRVTPVTPVNAVTVLIAPAVDVADPWSLGRGKQSHENNQPHHQFQYAARSGSGFSPFAGPSALHFLGPTFPLGLHRRTGLPHIQHSSLLHVPIPQIHGSLTYLLQQGSLVFQA